MGQLREYVDEGAPAHLLTTGHGTSGFLLGEADDADKLRSAMRKEFGGHEELPSGE